MKNITIERRDFIAKVGGFAAFSTMGADALADELEHQLEDGMAQNQEPVATPAEDNSNRSR